MLVSGARKPVRRGPEGVPESIEAAVDAERGFLHRSADTSKATPVRVSGAASSGGSGRAIHKGTSQPSTSTTQPHSTSLGW